MIKENFFLTWLHSQESLDEMSYFLLVPTENSLQEDMHLIAYSV